MLVISNLKKSTRTLIRAWSAQEHREELERRAMIGEKFCESAAVGVDYVLSARVFNGSGDRRRIRIGNYCNLSADLICGERGEILIGDYVFANNGTIIRSEHSVSIGSHCLFSPRVVIWDTDNHPLSRRQRHLQAEIIPLRRVDPRDADGGPITIGNDVWICMDALVLGGVTIGDGCIVAAHAVVTRDCPPMSIVAGVPAKIIGEVPC